VQGPGNAGDPFYLGSHRNVCVICGNTDQSQFRKFHVVPHAYRQHFPIYFKSHSAHDVVLLCLNCHPLADREMARMRRTISIEMKVPLDPEDDPR